MTKGALQPSEPKNHMKLKEAYLCLDCDTIFSVVNETNPCCPCCTSRSYAPVAGWISTMNITNSRGATDKAAAVEIEREPEARPYVFQQLVPDTMADRARRAGM